jgi:sugar O-acyltransferase (sialic acid O-acetyltransferase NeuD family)
VTDGRQPLVVVAASGLAREVMASRSVAGRFDLVGVLDDDRAKHGQVFGRTTVLGAIDDAVSFPDALFVVCAGRGEARERIASRLGSLGVNEDRYATIIDPTAVVPAGCEVGVGSILLSHVSLTADVTVGRHVVIMPHAVLTHDDRVDDFATICAGVALGGSVQVGTGAYLGMNVSVRQDLRIGEHATLGMGSVLLQDLPGRRTWAGVPARDLGARSLRSRNQLDCEPARPVGGLEEVSLP